MEKKSSKIATGILGFDDLAKDGIERGSVILIAGGTGTGKTNFCSQFLHYGAQQGENGLYITFEEDPDQIQRHVAAIGIDFSKFVKAGKTKFQKVDVYKVSKAVEAEILRAKGELLIDMKSLPEIIPRGFKPNRIVVDSLSALSAVFKPEDYRYFVFKFFSFLKSLGATVFAISETTQDPSEFSRTGIEEFLGDGVFVLYSIKQGDVRIRAVEILKLRGSSHEGRIVPFKITEKGIQVFPTQSILAAGEV